MQRTHKMLTLQRKEFEGLGLGVLPAQLWMRPRNTPVLLFSSPLSLSTGRNLGVGTRREGGWTLISPPLPSWEAGPGLCYQVLQQI